MALADFRTYPPGPFAPGTNVGGITFDSISTIPPPPPIEVRSGVGPGIGENGLGEAGGGPITGITADWHMPASAVVVRLSLHDNALIELYDQTGTLLVTRDVPAPSPQWLWQDVLFLVPAPGAVRAKLVGGGISALLSLVFTS